MRIEAIIKKLVVLAVLIISTLVIINFFRFPELYISTWRYQLHNDVLSGDPEGTDYYNRVYVSNGIELWEE